jgi:SAM-dependent methyltransferase
LRARLSGIARRGADRISPLRRARRRFNLHLQADPSWQLRAERAVDMWKRGGSVRDDRKPRRPLEIGDFGCGSERLHGVLEARLEERFTYQGYDLQPQVPGTISLDLGRELPAREFDVVFSLGLLEYLPDLESFVGGVARISSFAVLSYAVADAPDGLGERDRRQRGWVNHNSREQISALCDRAGFATLESLMIEEGRTGLWLLESRHRRARSER